MSCVERSIFFKVSEMARHSYGDVIPGDAFKNIFNSINKSGNNKADTQMSFKSSKCTESILSQNDDQLCHMHAWGTGLRADGVGTSANDILLCITFRSCNPYL